MPEGQPPATTAGGGVPWTLPGLSVHQAELPEGVSAIVIGPAGDESIPLERRAVVLRDDP